MPRRRGDPRRPQHTVAMEQERWLEVGRLLDEQGSDRTEFINACFAWFRHEPGAKMPKRPPREADSA